MKKNNHEPELATYTILNPDFYASEGQWNAEQKDDENHENSDAMTKSE
ncbi:hypothetical protein [Virgibacillus oceani]|uniref:Uncharacterized protein n=1 Tax=Virgibacillus oceani TaxID=1479511 RepID=A0A917HDR8_9BACI|nr:hypothetical protein [Virgibacillus oceani]GGG75120.1 hypothetical protein GCM10011398_19910 [Virgibacillus oceani]